MDEVSFDNLNILDLTDFKAIRLLSKINYLQEVINSNIHSIYLNNANSLDISVLSRELNIENGSLYFEKSSEIDLNNYSISKIEVKYDEDYSYNSFTEYNMDNDIISSLQDCEAIEQCLSEQKDCSYVESYSYSIYLEISLKECI